MTGAIIAFTKKGAALGKTIGQRLGFSVFVPGRLSEDCQLPAYMSLTDWTREQFSKHDVLVFVGACGIAVRAIAPYVRDKFTDPAVISLDEKGQFVIPLLSGHVGGANKMAETIAAITGGMATISTATDVNGCFAVDVWAREHKLLITDRKLAKEVSAALLEQRPVSFRSDLPLEGMLPKGLTEEEQKLTIHVTARRQQQENTLTLVPKCLILGIGCRRNTPKEAIEEAVSVATKEFYREAFGAVSSIDLKADEEGLLDWCRGEKLPITFFSADTLNRQPGDFTPSRFVKSTTGTDNVCERSVAALGGTILKPKYSHNGVTVAVGMLPIVLRFDDTKEERRTIR